MLQPIALHHAHLHSLTSPLCICRAPGVSQRAPINRFPTFPRPACRMSDAARHSRSKSPARPYESFKKNPMSPIARSVGQLATETRLPSQSLLGLPPRGSTPPRPYHSLKKSMLTKQPSPGNQTSMPRGRHSPPTPTGEWAASGRGDVGAGGKRDDRAAKPLQPDARDVRDVRDVRGGRELRADNAWGRMDGHARPIGGSGFGGRTPDSAGYRGVDDRKPSGGGSGGGGGHRGIVTPYPDARDDRHSHPREPPIASTRAWPHQRSSPPPRGRSPPQGGRRGNNSGLTRNRSRSVSPRQQLDPPSFAGPNPTYLCSPPKRAASILALIALVCVCLHLQPCGVFQISEPASRFPRASTRRQRSQSAVAGPQPATPGPEPWARAASAAPDRCAACTEPTGRTVAETKPEPKPEPEPEPRTQWSAVQARPALAQPSWAAAVQIPSAAAP